MSRSDDLGHSLPDILPELSPDVLPLLLPGQALPYARLLHAANDREWMEAALKGNTLHGGLTLRNVSAVLDGPACLTVPTAPKRPAGMPATVQFYHETVKQYAAKYALDPALVLAIVQAESGFNPTLVSARDAHGLMQVVPGTAGSEVNRWLGQKDSPTTAELLNPENNIRYGTAYLHLLNTRHLNGIANPISREYCMIASYNGGSGALLRYFATDTEDGLTVINRLQPYQVLERLMNDYPSAETRAFMSKVLISRDSFSAMNKFS